MVSEKRSGALHVNASKALAAAQALDIEDIYTVNEKTVHEAYRREAKLCHPDAPGHSAVRWAEISHAHSVLRAWVAARTLATQKEMKGAGDCRSCAGTGFIQKRNGFRLGLKIACVLCNGTGNVTRSDRDV